MVIMSKFINKDNVELNTDVLLWSGAHSGYSHQITLNQDVLKFKEMICVVKVNGSAEKTISFSIIDGKIYVSSGMVESYKVMSCSCESYNSSTFEIEIGTCVWTNSSNNEGAILLKVYGRY